MFLLKGKNTFNGNKVGQQLYLSMKRYFENWFTSEYDRIESKFGYYNELDKFQEKSIDLGGLLWFPLIILV